MASVSPSSSYFSLEDQFTFYAACRSSFAIFGLSSTLASPRAPNQPLPILSVSKRCVFFNMNQRTNRATAPLTTFCPAAAAALDNPPGSRL